MRILSINCDILEFGVVIVDYNVKWKSDMLALLKKLSLQSNSGALSLTELDCLEKLVDERIKIVYSSHFTLCVRGQEKYERMLETTACLKGMLDDITSAFPVIDNVLIRYHNKSSDADRISSGQIAAYFIAPSKNIKTTFELPCLPVEKHASHPTVFFLDSGYISDIMFANIAEFNERFSVKVAAEKHAVANFEEFMRRYNQNIPRKNHTYIVAVAFLQCYAWIAREFE